MNFRRRPTKPKTAAPNSATVAPPSGTFSAEVFAEKEKFVLDTPPDDWDENAHMPGVGSKPAGPVRIPVPVMSRNAEV